MGEGLSEVSRNPSTIQPSWMDTEARIRADWAGLVVIRDVIRPVTLSPAFALCIVATCLCSSSASPLPNPFGMRTLYRRIVVPSLSLSLCLSVSISLCHSPTSLRVYIYFVSLSFSRLCRMSDLIAGFYHLSGKIVSRDDRILKVFKVKVEFRSTV